MSNKVRIIVEIVDQPPFETRARTWHRSVVVESRDLADLLIGTGVRVIAGVPEESESTEDYGHTRTGQ